MSDIEARVKKIIAEQLGVPESGDDDAAAAHRLRPAQAFWWLVA